MRSPDDEPRVHIGLDGVDKVANAVSTTRRTESAFQAVSAKSSGRSNSETAVQNGVRRRARSEQAARRKAAPDRLGQRRHRGNRIKTHQRCRRRGRCSRLVTLIFVLAMFGAQVRRGRIQLAHHHFRTAGHLGRLRRRSRARVRSHAPLRKQQRKDRDRNHT